MMGDIEERLRDVEADLRAERQRRRAVELQVDALQARLERLESKLRAAAGAASATTTAVSGRKRPRPVDGWSADDDEEGGARARPTSRARRASTSSDSCSDSSDDSSSSGSSDGSSGSSDGSSDSSSSSSRPSARARTTRKPAGPPVPAARTAATTRGTAPAAATATLSAPPAAAVGMAVKAEVKVKPEPGGSRAASAVGGAGVQMAAGVIPAATATARSRSSSIAAAAAAAGPPPPATVLAAAASSSSAGGAAASSGSAGGLVGLTAAAATAAVPGGMTPMMVEHWGAEWPALSQPLRRVLWQAIAALRTYGVVAVSLAPPLKPAGSGAAALPQPVQIEPLMWAGLSPPAPPKTAAPLSLFLCLTMCFDALRATPVKDANGVRFAQAGGLEVALAGLAMSAARSDVPLATASADLLVALLARQASDFMVRLFALDTGTILADALRAVVSDGQRGGGGDRTHAAAICSIGDFAHRLMTAALARMAAGAPLVDEPWAALFDASVDALSVTARGVQRENTWEAAEGRGVQAMVGLLSTMLQLPSPVGDGLHKRALERKLPGVLLSGLELRPRHARQKHIGLIFCRLIAFAQAQAPWLLRNVCFKLSAGTESRAGQGQRIHAALRSVLNDAKMGLAPGSTHVQVFEDATAAVLAAMRSEAVSNSASTAGAAASGKQAPMMKPAASAPQAVAAAGSSSASGPTPKTINPPDAAPPVAARAPARAASTTRSRSSSASRPSASATWTSARPASASTDATAATSAAPAAHDADGGSTAAAVEAASAVSAAGDDPTDAVDAGWSAAHADADQAPVDDEAVRGGDDDDGRPRWKLQEGEGW